MISRGDQRGHVHLGEVLAFRNIVLSSDQEKNKRGFRGDPARRKVHRKGRWCTFGGEPW